MLFPPARARSDQQARAAQRLSVELRRQGFLPTQHFAQRLLERGLAQGIRFDPRTFATEFQQARHLRQTRRGYHTRIAVMRSLPVLYRQGGAGGNRVVLVGLLPADARPPAAPVKAPRQRESEAMVARRQRSPNFRCQICRAWHGGLYGAVCPDCHTKAQGGPEPRTYCPVCGGVRRTA
jgi:hypothetical protein